MFGRKSFQRTVHTIKVERLPADLPTDNCVFAPVFPTNSRIRDIMIYKPYIPGRNLTIKFYNDESVVILTKTGLAINKLHSIDLSVTGMVPIEVESTSAPHLVIVYDT